MLCLLKYVQNDARFRFVYLSRTFLKVSGVKIYYLYRMGACLKFLELPLFPNEVISVFTPVWFQFKCQICFVSHSCIHKIWVRHRYLFMCAYIYVYYMLMLTHKRVLQMIFLRASSYYYKQFFQSKYFLYKNPSVYFYVYTWWQNLIWRFLCA